MKKNIKIYFRSYTTNIVIFRLFNPNGGAVPLPPNAHHFPPLPIPPSGNGAAHSSHLPSPHHLVPIHPPHPGNGLTNAVMPSPLGAASAALLQHHHQQQHQLLQVSLKQYRKENFLEIVFMHHMVNCSFVYATVNDAFDIHLDRM